MNKYSPGPWSIEDRGDPDMASIIDGEGDVVANINRSRYVDERNDPTQSANLALIAGAPNLIAALRQCAFVVESVAHLKNMERDLLPVAEWARAAIAEAEGK